MTDQELIEVLRRELADNSEAYASCEGCGAPLFDADDFCNDDCSGCWQWATGFHESTKDAPCYKYRVPEMAASRERAERAKFEVPTGADRYITDEIRERLSRLNGGGK